MNVNVRIYTVSKASHTLATVPYTQVSVLHNTDISGGWIVTVIKQ
jgi:hypothetical protein